MTTVEEWFESGPIKKDTLELWLSLINTKEIKC